MPSIISRASRTIETAFLKYGMINFTLTLYLLPFGVTDPKSVLALEQYFIDPLNPEYNICKIAGCSKGRVVPERTKNKLREERGNKIYAYSVDGSRLLYTFLSRTSLMQTLSIHRSSLNQALETGSPYINLLLFKLTLINNADNSNPMDLTELVKLCSDRQKVKRSKKTNPNSLPTQATHISDPTLSFVLPSTRKMAHHFGVDKSTITAYILSGKVFKESWILTTA